MSIQSPVGTLDIKNATLRVGKLEVSNIQGVDTALNVTRANSVLIYDDQASTTTFTGFTSSASVRDTGNGFLNLAAAYVYWGQKLPNAWVMEFEVDIRSGTSAGPLNVNLYSSTYTGNDGYSILFDDNGDNLVLKYDGSTLATASVSGLFTVAESWQKVVINYERGMVSVSVGGSRKLYYKDVERSTPYTVGEYINFTSSSTDGRKLRKLKITNGSKLVYSGESNVVYTHGSLGIGVKDPSTALEVSGTTKSTAFVGDGSGITNITSANVNDFGSNVSRIGNLESNVLQLQTEDMNISGKKTFEDQVTFESNILVKGDLLVANTVNMVVSDPIIELGSNNLNTGDLGLVMTRHGATNSNVAVFYDESEDALKLGYTLGGAYDTSLELDSNLLAVNLQGNLEVGTANLFVDTTTGNVGVGTDAPLARLDVHGTANVGTLTTTTMYGEIAGSNALAASTGAFSGDLEVGTANLFVDTTTSNVGVGTDTPLATLDIQGDVLINSNLSVGPSSNLFVDATTGNVGISNTAPVHTLDIGSNVYVQEGGDTVLTVLGNAVVSNKLTVQSFRISSSSSSGLQAVTTGVGANSTSNRIEITNADNSTSTSTGALALTNGGLGVAGDVVTGGSLTLAGDLAVNGSTFNVDSTQNRVGILTASPQYPLDVHGSANVGTFITTGATVTGDLTVDTQTLKVDSGNDRVGVNTAFPAYTLDVHGAANVGALTTTSVSGEGSGLTALNADNISSGTLDNARLPSTINVTNLVGDGSGITNILSSSVNDFSSNVSRIAALESGDLTIDGEKTFSSNLEVGTANLFVDTVTGNVGVGTTEPRAPLHVNATSAMIIPYGTTAQQPTGQTGMLRFNTTLSRLQVYDGTNWTTIGAVSASGGTVTYADGYAIHAFTSSDNFTVYNGGDVEYLVVAGGASGAVAHQTNGVGGGGAGGMLTGSTSISPGTYTITVGTGGNGFTTSTPTDGNDGTDSSISDLGITAEGGGGGGAATLGNGRDGGSGGGAATYNVNTADTEARTGGSGVSGQGNDGRSTTGIDGRGAGGGGGAGATGGAIPSDGVGGAGGIGIQSSISGTATYYAGGGGATGWDTASGGSGGSGGGGDAGTKTTNASNGTDGLGGGGGASKSGKRSGDGGDGIVIIRYLT